MAALLTVNSKSRSLRIHALGDPIATWNFHGAVKDLSTVLLDSLGSFVEVLYGDIIQPEGGTGHLICRSDPAFDQWS